LPTRTQQQQTRQIQRLERYLRQHAFETLAHDRARNPMHASTQNSSRAPQPLLPAAFEPARTLSTLHACTQQQQTRQIQRLERYLRQHAFETRAHDLKPKHFTQARKTLRGRLSHCCRQRFSHAEHSAHCLHAHSSSKHAKISVQNGTCASTRLKRSRTT
jgi:hypothetical protein